MKEAELWEPLPGGGARCLLCARGCAVKEGARGFCRVRELKGGRLYSLNYGYDGALNLDPVEKKPLYHFLPGTLTFSVGAPGCSFDCLGCQNSSLSRPDESWPGAGARRADPGGLARAALETGAKSLSFTYSEPTVFFEYARDVGEAAAALGLPSVWVTNGFMGRKVLEAVAPHVRAMNIDLKGFTDSFYREVAKGRLAPVLDSISGARELGIWVEATTLLIPGLNDSDSELAGLAGFLAALDPHLPWHISRFSPMRLQSHLSPTEPKDLERAREIGLAQGLRHVYIGNARGSGYADTLCPGCGEPVVSRDGFAVFRDALGADGKCPFCGARVAGVWA
ncbi:MAG: AmmeMemoRadiSam system radical SAM enzyme [Deltaproteobacteria bacterium]|nr:AmmeMemoRadiSam system radical SAM enzyme [Deltaproteobacteria bacterium]